MKEKEVYSKLTSEQKSYFDFDVALKKFERDSVELINSICDKAEAIIKDINNYDSNRVTQKIVDDGFKFYKIVMKMSQANGFHRGKATAETISYLYVKDDFRGAGIDYALCMFFANDDAMLKDAKERLNKLFSIITAINIIHDSMMDVIYCIASNSKDMPTKGSIAADLVNGIKLDKWPIVTKKEKPAA